jgi:hypothetical protein
MPFVLINAPTTLVRMMDDILWVFKKYFVVVYLDDILIFNQIWEENSHHIQHMWKHKLHANLERCSFSRKIIQYSGYIMDEHVVHVDRPRSKSFSIG